MIFQCPSCGAKNELERAENEFIHCSFCGSSSYVDLEGVISVYTYKSMIEKEEVILFLKKDFEKTGFSETFDVRSCDPLYIPFWDFENENRLEAGASVFRESGAVRPSEERRIFHFDRLADSVGIIEPDTIPDKTGKRSLCYLPFYKVEINYRGESYYFLVNGMNGSVSGDPIPFVSIKAAGSLFPRFLLVFMVAFTVNFVFDGFLPALFANAAAVYILFSLLISRVNRDLYSHER